MLIKIYFENADAETGSSFATGKRCVPGAASEI